MNCKQTIKVNEIKPHMEKIGITLKFEEKLKPKEVISKKTGKIYQVTDALAGDETGAIIVKIWGEKSDLIKEGKYYTLNDCKTKKFEGKLILEIGWQTEIKETQAKFEINTNNNKSI
jgi:ssDNA-binding replication factor A large subunit